MSFIVLSVISSSLLLKSDNIYQGFDTQFHLKRIVELSESIKQGQLFPKFSFNEFHGSAIMTLYPYFNLFPATFLLLIFKSKLILVYGFFIFNTFITFIISFFSSKNYIRFYSIAYIFSIIYSLSNIFLSYNLLITDFGIVSSYTFLPLIIFGFLKIISGRNSWLELCIGMTLLAFSHILNLVIISIFLLLWLIINIKNINTKVMMKLLKAILLFFIFTSIIWLPFIKLYFNNFSNIHMPVSTQLDRIDLKEFMSGIYGSKSFDTIGFFPIISIFISILFYKKFSIYIKQMYWLSVIIILFVLFLPWRHITSYHIFHVLTQFQNTFRFLIIPQMLLSFIFAMIVSQYMLFTNKKIIIYCITIFVAIFLQVIGGQYTFINKYSNGVSVKEYLENNNNHIYIGQPIGYKFNNSYQFYRLLNAYQDTNDDYIPKDAISKSTYVDDNLGFYNNKYTIQVNHSGYNTFTFDGVNNINTLSLPLYAYNKEKLNIYLNKQPIKYHVNKDGLLTIDNIQHQIKAYNSISIKSNYDVFRLIGIILFTLGSLFILGIFVKNKFIN